MASIVPNIIEQVKIGDNYAALASTAYGYCESDAAAPIKIVDIDGFALIRGVTIHVKFANGNTYASPTMNVQNTGALPIMQYGTTHIGADTFVDSWPDGAVLTFTYDGVNWVKDFSANTVGQFTVKHTYNNTSTDAISGKGVADAISGLTISDITNTGAGYTIDTVSESNGKVNVTFQQIQIGEEQVTNLQTHLNDKAPINNPTFTGNVTLPGAPTADNEAATKKYVDEKTAKLTSAMHYIGAATVSIVEGSDGDQVINVSNLPVGHTLTAGDVVTYESAEYVYDGSKWLLLGDEGSYALKSKTENVVKTVGFTANTTPSLTITDTSIPNITNVGSAPTLTHSNITVNSVASNSEPTQAAVENGVLVITIGSASTYEAKTVSSISNWDAGAAPTLGSAITVGSASGWDAGSAASVSPIFETVVVP